eukprot:COSAG01_NODE_4802_length_4734_cov_2.711111_6_plen_174_part_00
MTVEPIGVIAAGQIFEALPGGHRPSLQMHNEADFLAKSYAQVVSPGYSLANQQPSVGREADKRICWVTLAADDHFWAEAMSGSELVLNAGGGQRAGSKHDLGTHTTSADAMTDAMRERRRKQRAFYLLGVGLTVWLLARGRYLSAVLVPLMLCGTWEALDWLNDQDLGTARVR